jgi:hypothetical protein
LEKLAEMLHRKLGAWHAAHLCLSWASHVSRARSAAATPPVKGGREQVTAGKQPFTREFAAEACS